MYFRRKYTCFSLVSVKISQSWVIQIQSMNKLRVIEFEGLAPSVFCGMYFADQGAEVIFVARGQSGGISMPFNRNILNRNKKCIQLSFKNKEHLKILHELLKTADIVIDPFRPGVLQKLKLGPKELYQLNKRIILLRVSGYGQTGPNKLRPGHDMNYMAVGGIIPIINRSKQYEFPSNYVADFVSSSLGITGVLGALHRRQKSGQGCQVDCSLANGCTYLVQNMLQVDKSTSQADELIRTLKIQGKEYIITGKNAAKINESSVKQLLQEKDHYRSQNGDIQISQIKGFGPLDPNAFNNPFSDRAMKHVLREKGENNEEIMSQIRPKL